jgi:hypothetical protein
MLAHFIGSQEILYIYVAKTWKKENNCTFMSGNGLHIVLLEPMFSINGFSRVQVGTFFGPHFQFFQLNTTLSESTPRKFVVYVESTLYPSI